MTDEPAELVCDICRQLSRWRVCSSCRTGLAKQLRDLVRKIGDLEVAVLPSQRRGDGVRVAASKPGGSPTPARLDALSLAAPGSVRVTAMLHPKVRHWQTSRDVDVQVLQTSRKIIAGRTVERASIVTERRTIVEWHRELVRDDAGDVVYIAPDDQIGTIPPREWLTSWVRLWQQVLRHSIPPVPRRFGHARAATLELATLAATPAGAAAVAAWAAVKAAYDQSVTDTLTGRTFGHAGDVTRWARTDDPLADDLEARFGDLQQTSEVAASDVAFLLTWLDEACDHPDVPIADFAGELRALSAELTRVLGEQPDQMWIGRCPARITDPATGTARPCGAGLWQDPHASQVQCPRCHTTWGPRRVDLLHLATEMRRTWPVDRRRRYTLEETEVVRRPKCPTCGQLADIVWKEVTGLNDPVRTWQPTDSLCPAGCEEARQVI